MPKYIIAIDGGSQSTKVAVYDLEGNVICEDRHPLRPCILAEGGVVEHPDDDLWDSLCFACTKLMSRFQGEIKDIIGIGIGSIRCCRVLLKADGTLVAPVINWQDERTARPYEFVEGTAYVTSLTGYLAHRLTGAFKDCIGNNLGQYPVDYKKWQWSDNPQILEKFNIPANMLFESVLPGNVVGSISEQAAAAMHLPAHLPLVITSADKPVEMLGCGLLNGSTAVVSLGTYISLMTMGDKLPANPQAFWSVMSSIPYKLIYEGYGIRRGMWTVSWFRELLGQSPLEEAAKLGISAEDYLNKEGERVPPGCEGLMTILDWLANPWQPFKRGIILGFSAQMDFAYIYRSILEGIAYTLKNNFDAMCEELEQKPAELIITGGGANSKLFMQIFADIFNLPVKRNESGSAAGLGAAINTAVALNCYNSYEEAVKNMVRIKDTFLPIDENVERYASLCKIYREIPDFTDDLLKKIHALLKSTKDKTAVIDKW